MIKLLFIIFYDRIITFIKKSKWIWPTLFGITGIIIFYFFAPTDLNDRLDFYSIYNLVLIIVAFIFSIISEYPFKTNSQYKIFEIAAFLIAIWASIMVIITSGDLTRKQEMKLFNLNKKLMQVEHSSDSASKMQENKILVLGIELVKKGKELEEEKIKRLLLEEDISPRIIRQDFFLRLRKFKNIRITIECVDDLEALRFTNNLNQGFKLANWDVSLVSLEDDWVNIKDGIKMEVHTSLNGDSRSIEMRKAFEELKKILQVNNIQIQTGYSNSIDPKYLIKIIVGFKPIPSIFFAKKRASSIEKLTNEELMQLDIEIIQELKDFDNIYKEKEYSARVKYYQDNPHILGPHKELSNKEWEDSIAVWNDPLDKIEKSIKTEKLYIFNRDYKLKVQWIFDEYIRRYPKAKKMLKDMHRSPNWMKFRTENVLFLDIEGINEMLELFSKL